MLSQKKLFFFPVNTSLECFLTKIFFLLLSPAMEAQKVTVFHRSLMLCSQIVLR